jgi:hypothetical protein
MSTRVAADAPSPCAVCAYARRCAEPLFHYATLILPLFSSPTLTDIIDISFFDFFLRYYFFADIFTLRHYFSLLITPIIFHC